MLPLLRGIVVACSLAYFQIWKIAAPIFFGSWPWHDWINKGSCLRSNKRTIANCMLKFQCSTSNSNPTFNFLRVLSISNFQFQGWTLKIEGVRGQGSERGRSGCLFAFISWRRRRAGSGRYWALPQVAGLQGSGYKGLGVKDLGLEGFRLWRL